MSVLLESLLTTEQRCACQWNDAQLLEADMAVHREKLAQCARLESPGYERALTAQQNALAARGELR